MPQHFAVRITAAIAAVAVLSAPAAAQASWQAMPTLSNATYNAGPARAFWNNGSMDGTGCNVGFIVTATNGACANQRPTNWLPYTGPAQSVFLGNSNAATPFLFAAGTYVFNQTPGLGGDIAAANTNWGFFTANASGNLLATLAPITGNAGQQIVTFTNAWGFYMDMARIGTGPGATLYSNDVANARQFALFSNNSNGMLGLLGNSTFVTAGLNQSFTVGFEDIACDAQGICSGADFDNNDAMLSFAPVPEPSTWALTVGGLVTLGAMARRKQARV